MKEDAGLPSKNIRDPDYEVSGYPRGRPSGHGRRKHEMREVEFYTDLTETVQEFIRDLNRIPRPQWRERMEQFVALKNESHVRSHDWFRTWKRDAPDKWRKAVAEFIKEVESRVDIPGSSDIRRIAMHSLDLERLALRIERLQRTRTIPDVAQPIRQIVLQACALLI